MLFRQRVSRQKADRDGGGDGAYRGRIGADSEFRAPMALVVIGGLVTSTLLSLIFVPVAYLYVDRAETWIARRFRPKGARGGVAAE